MREANSAELVARLAGIDSPVARLLQRSIVRASPLGEVELAFVGAPEFCNERGSMQGGLVAAMLDATLGNAIKAMLLPDGLRAPITLELSVRFVRPARTGPVRARGRVVHRGGSVAVAQAELLSECGDLLALATSTKLIGRLP